MGGAGIGAGAGAAIGVVVSFIPGVNIAWWSAMALGASLGGTVGGYVDPPEPPDTSESRQSPTYGWNLGKTDLDPWAPVQVIYGKPRTGGVLLAQQIKAKNNRHKEKMWLLIGLGEGPIGSSDSDIVDDVWINGEPIASQSDTEKWSVSHLNYIGHPESEVVLGKKLYGILRPGDEDQSIIGGFKTVENSVGININLLNAEGPYTYSTSRPIESFGIGIDLPNGLIEYRQGSKHLHEDPSRVRFLVRYRKRGTNSWNLVAGGKPWKSDKTKNLSFLNMDGSGKSNQPSIPTAENPLKWDKIYFGAWDESKTALHLFWDIVDHDDVPRTPTYTARKKGEKLDLDYYDIRIERATKDVDGNAIGKVIKDTDLKYITEITYDKLNHPHTALFGVTGTSTKRLGGGIPNISMLVKGRRVKNLSTGLTSWSQNAMWCLADLITNDRYGLGQWYSETEIDSTSFVAAAAWCDATVRNKNGTTEARVLLDLVIDKKMRAIDAINRIAMISQVMVVLSNGQWKVVIDQDGASVQSFTTEGSTPNIVEKSFEFSTTPISNQVNVLEITFQNADKDYETDTVVVEDRTALDRGDAIRRESMELFGVTRPTHAYRVGSYILGHNLLANALYSWVSPIGAIVAEAGDIIDVTNPDYELVAQKCRIVKMSYTEDYKVSLVTKKHDANVYNNSGDTVIYTPTYTSYAKTASSSIAQAYKDKMSRVKFTLEEVEQ